MKKLLLLALVVLLTTTITRSQETIYSGKYRAIFYDIAKEHGKRHQVQKVTDSLTYLIMGFQTGDDFMVQVSKTGTDTLVMTQTFYMNGEKKNDVPAIQSWFKGEYTLDRFLKEVFDYQLPTRRTKKTTG